VLVAWDDKPLATQMDLNLQLNRAWPGDSVNLTLIRDGKKMTVLVKLGEGHDTLTQ